MEASKRSNGAEGGVFNDSNVLFSIIDLHYNSCLILVPCLIVIFVKVTPFTRDGC